MYIIKRGGNIFHKSNQIFGHTGVNPDPLNDAYGVIYNSNNPSTYLQRIGNLAKHVSLPVQSGMRRCLLLDDGTVNYYLDDNDSTLKADGVTPSVLDGSDGQVMVEIPEHWQFFKQEGALYYAYISDVAVAGFTHVPKTYYGAYWGRNISSKLSSVSGQVPTVLISVTSGRTLARARGGTSWNCDNYFQRKLIYWLFVIEYANTNSQDAVINALNDEGYRQGGLGVGVTEGLYAEGKIVSGLTNELGNNTGEIHYIYSGQDTKVNSYRGIEMPFGHLWSCTDGVHFRSRASGDGGALELWSADDPADWNDTSRTGYVYQGDVRRGTYYIRSIIGSGNYIANSENKTGAPTNYICDGQQTIDDADSTETIYGLRSGGTASFGTFAGFGCSSSTRTPSAEGTNSGSRLCYIP